jgi:hypothetical protein
MIINDIILKETTIISPFGLTRYNKVAELSESHIRNVLGVEIPLTESVYSFKYREQILYEQELYEGMLDSVKTYLGNKYTTTVNDINGGIKDFKDAAILIKDTITNPDGLPQILQQIKKYFTNTVWKPLINLFNKFIEQISGGSIPQELIDKVIWVKDFLVAKVQSLLAITGWTGFMTIIGIYGFISFIKVKVQGLVGLAVDTAIDSIKDFFIGTFDMLKDNMDKVMQTAASTSIGAFFTAISVIKEVHAAFITMLSYIKSKIWAGRTVQANTNPVGEDIQYLKKLSGIQK